MDCKIGSLNPIEPTNYTPLKLNGTRQNDQRRSVNKYPTTVSFKWKEKYQDVVNLPYIESKDASKIYYEMFGDGKSYPIILIHPIGGNIDIWEHEIQFILKKPLE